MNDYKTKENIARHFYEHLADKLPSIKLEGMNLNETVHLHKTVGQVIRNDYKLWLNNHPLTKSWFENQNPDHHPDRVSMDIINLAWRLANENWPFYMNDVGANLKADRIYAFNDCGGFAGKFEGYDTAEAAINDLTTEGEMSENEYSTDPDELGTCVSVLSGRQFVDQLYIINNGVKSDFDMYGNWAPKAEPKKDKLA